MPLDLKVSSEELAQLRSALLSAFPRAIDLAQLVRFRLDENLYAFAAQSPLDQTVFDLLMWAESQGRLRDLVLGALEERPRNPDLQAFAEQIGLTPPKAAPVALGEPAPDKAGLLVDLSHGQGEWDYGAGSIFRVTNGPLLSMLPTDTETSAWEVKAIPDRRQIDAASLAAWKGMILGMPHHVRIEDTTRYEIVTWVRQGGRLVLLGFELGERHHETNFNALADEFGLRFNSDIAAPKAWQPPWKPYDEPIDFPDIESTHPVMNGISALRFWNLCTLNPEPGAHTLLTLGENSIGYLQRDGVNYTSKGWLRGGNQKFDVNVNASWAPVIAEAPAGLTGQGRVLALGTWMLIGKNYSAPGGFDNLQFIANLLRWAVAL